MKYYWEHFSGLAEIIHWLNNAEFKLEVVSINNDDRGNWWLIYKR